MKNKGVERMLRTELPKIVSGIVPGVKSKALLEKRNAAVPKAMSGSTYPICIARGEGAMLEDLDGNIFLDWIGGVGVLNVGYSHPEVIEAVKEQADKYFHTIFNVVVHDGYVELAEKMNEIMPVRGDKKKTYFANSGAEADENAIKVAKGYTKRSSIICFSGAFHGRTNLMMALTANQAYAIGMGPFPDGIYRAEYPYLYRAPKGYTEEKAIQYYLDKLEDLFKNVVPANQVAAILMEPLQGEGGFIAAPVSFVKAVREICDKHGILLIADEVQCGNCRTGKYFASEYWAEVGAAPDIITTAKSMGAGLPISCITASAEIMDAVTPGTIGGTYCGNPVAAASALKTMEILKRDNYAEKAKHIGTVATNAFCRMMGEYEIIGDVRGMGAMIGIEFVQNKESKEPNKKAVDLMIQKAIQKGLLLESAGAEGNVIRFLAPLCMTDEQMSTGLEIFEECIKEVTLEVK